MNKKLVTALVAVSLTTALAIGGTLAFLSAETDTKKNTFTMGTGLYGAIDEPNWDEEEAQGFTPGKVIAKDPLIMNISPETTEPAWIAAKLQYQVQDENGNWVDCDFADLDKFINIQSGNPLADGFNVTDWTFSDDYESAYYNVKVASGDQTATLFDAVEIDKLALTKEQIASAADETKKTQFDESKYDGDYADYEMKNFQIIVSGYLVQGSDDFADAKAAAETAFPEAFSSAVVE